jgi:hypothetical protein
MLRALARPLVIAALVAVALGQANVRPRLLSITAPVRHAGTFHVATGTWTRKSSLANLVGPDVVYNNTCAAAYFSRQQYGEKWQHRSCLPSPTHPTVPSAYYPQRNDEAPGCATSYTIDGFEFAYCSSAGLGTPNHIDYLFEFADSYTDCADLDMVATASILLTGLPGGTTTGSQNCWIIDVDLAGSGQSFVLQADGDGTYSGPSTNEQFGWSLGPASANVTLATFTGPIIAGDYTWTGGWVSGVLTPCTGTDGTLWDSPVSLIEEGTGMASNDFFRATGNASLPNGPGCYSYGRNPHADFWLKLFGDAGCAQPMTSLCTPGVAGVIPCPCQNANTAYDSGCGNFVFDSGASLSANGTPSLSADTLRFATQHEWPEATSALLQGTSVIPGGVVYGQGVRCVAGSLARLYVAGAVGGSISVPRPGDPSVSALSAQRGDTIPAGATRFYLVYYRTPYVQGGCPPTSTFNCTQTGSVVWGP